jgi:hypothetical protein
MMRELADAGWVLWKFAGGEQAAWRIGELRKMLRAIWPNASDEEIERKIFRYFIPDDFCGR